MEGSHHYANALYREHIWLAADSLNRRQYIWHVLQNTLGEHACVLVICASLTDRCLCLIKITGLVAMLVR